MLVHALALALADAIRRRPLERLVFNVAQYAICWAVAGGLLVALTGDLPDENGLQYLELALRCPRSSPSAALFLALNTAAGQHAAGARARDEPAADDAHATCWLNTWWTVVLVALVPGDPRRRRLRACGCSRCSASRWWRSSSAAARRSSTSTRRATTG